MIALDFYSATTFGYGAHKGFTKNPESLDSMRLMFERTGSNAMVLPVVALQDHAYSTKIDWLTQEMMDEADIRTCTELAHDLGKKVILKAMVNCRDGYWRAYINFFDTDVPCEPKWGDWFEQYTAFNCYLADIAQKVRADMLCVGCEMVGTDRKEGFWRNLVSEVRKRYSGPVTYNCDKYQEHNVTWWDCVDVISSSGYYPINNIDVQFNRIKGVAEQWGKPFMFMECGCPGRVGSEYNPNDWAHLGDTDIDVQTRWYRAFTEAIDRNDWIRGVGWWDWSARLYPIETAMTNNGYGIYGKPAEKLLFEWNRKRGI